MPESVIRLIDALASLMKLTTLCFVSKPRRFESGHSCSILVKPEVQKLTTYELWCKHTGNPKKFSVQEFKTLLAESLVKECSFETYKYCTGNHRSLTKEEFEALVKADTFDFSGVWDVQ